jgi:hypothetical protein
VLLLRLWLGLRPVPAPMLLLTPRNSLRSLFATAFAALAAFFL